MNLSFMLKPFKAAVTSLPCLRPPRYTPVARRRRLVPAVSADQQQREPEVDLDNIFSLAISLKYEGVEKIENLQIQLHELEQEREKMMQLMYMAALDKAMQEVLNEEAHIDLVAAVKKIETLESQKIDMQICVEGALQRAEDKERQLEASAAQNAAAKQEYGQLLAEMEALRYEIESERRTMGISLESALQSVKDKEQELEAITADNEVVVLEHVHLLTEMEVLSNQVEIKESERRKMGISLESALQSVKDKEQELEAVTADNEAVVLEHAHLLTEMEVLSNQVEIKESEKKETEASLQIALEMVQNKERELEASTAENFQLKEDNIRLRTFYDVERERMKKQEVRNANEIDALQTKVESCLVEKMDLERQVEELRFQLESMKPSDKQEAHELKQINGWGILKDGVLHAQDSLRENSEMIMFGSICTSFSSWMENGSTTLTYVQKVESPLGASVRDKERDWMVQSAGLVQAVKEGEEMIESCEDGAAGENLVVQRNQLNKEHGKLTMVDEKTKQKREHKKILHDNGCWHRAEILKVAKSAADNEGRRGLLQKSMQCSDMSKKLEVEGGIADTTEEEKLNKELESKVQSAELVQMAKETGPNKKLESMVQSSGLVQMAKETGANKKLESKVQSSGLVQTAKEREAIVHSCEEEAVVGNMVLQLKEQDENLMMVEFSRRQRAEILKNHEKVLHENGRRQIAEILKVVKLAPAYEERRRLHQKSVQNGNERENLEVAVVMADTTKVPPRNRPDGKQYAEFLPRKPMINNGDWRSRRSSEKWGMQVEGSNEHEGSWPDQSRYRRR